MNAIKSYRTSNYLYEPIINQELIMRGYQVSELDDRVELQSIKEFSILSEEEFGDSEVSI